MASSSSAADDPVTDNNRPNDAGITTTHGYRDFANEADLPPVNLTVAHKNGSNSEQNFPVKLHYMLSDMEADGLDHIVSWQPHGRSFIVHKPDAFVSQILLLWFRQTKYSSFQRQLNLYGFKRITAGPDKGAHYHELFLRGKRHLAHRITRMKVKGQGARKPAQPAQEPNFYELPRLPPNPPKQIQQQEPTVGSVLNHHHHSAASAASAAAMDPRVMSPLLPSAATNRPEASSVSALYAQYLGAIPYPQLPPPSNMNQQGSVTLTQLLAHYPSATTNTMSSSSSSLLNNLSPQVLSTLLKDGFDGAALLDQLRRGG